METVRANGVEAPGASRMGRLGMESVGRAQGEEEESRSEADTSRRGDHEADAGTSRGPADRRRILSD